MDINYRAVRSYVKIYEPIARRQWFGRQEAQTVKRFAEWSDRAHAHISEVIEERIADYVGIRFGLTGEELLHQVWLADNIHSDFYWNAKLGNKIGLVEAEKRVGCSDNSWDLEGNIKKALRMK